MNALSLESSPYLQQHQNNPIHWKAWSESTLSNAAAASKLLIISIGYATCHWCHVMEKESFENEAVAEIMNTHFTSIKVDREEHMDVDAYYMKAVQLMTKQGGWPLHAICLPDGRPIWGGTYFNTKDWTESLLQLQELYTKSPDKVLEFAEKLQEGISLLSQAPTQDDDNRFDREYLIDVWKRSFDWEYGGHAKAPKFMMPNNLSYLQKLGTSTQDSTLLNYVDLTLTKLAQGGIFDTLHGGFFRYSVDFKWHIPHFEKMLYDNAQLVSLYADAYKRTQNPIYRACIEKTLLFIEEEWSNGEGGYYSALDADSLNAKNESKEGAYYTWEQQELQSILGDEFDLFSQVFNINPTGYWEDNQYVLIQTQPLEQLAKTNNITTETLQKFKIKWEAQLRIQRLKRTKPLLDDKTITSWNALMAIGYLDAYTALQNPLYLEKGLHIIAFIKKNLYREEEGLKHVYKQGTSKIEAYLDDYAWYIKALLTAYTINLDEVLLYEAKAHMDLALDTFLDEQQGFFKYAQPHDAQVPPTIEVEDNVIPSSNAAMAHNLYLLGLYFENLYYSQLSESMLNIVLTKIDYPSYYSHWLLLEHYRQQQAELSIIGPEAQNIIAELHQKFQAHTLILGAVQDSQIPYFKNKYKPDSTLFYYCKNKSCQAPTTSLPEQLY